jgi:lactate racemase
MTDTSSAPDKSKCVTILDESTPVTFYYGESGFYRENLPKGTRVIYPPPATEGVPNVHETIEHALEYPHGCEPLRAQLKPGMKVTIAFDDISLPLPQMRRPDIRELIITNVLGKLADAGIDDIHIVAAIALHRRMTPGELKHQLGNKIFKQYFPHQLYNYDAEDPDGNVMLGKTEQGEEVEISRRVLESDLVIYVNINLVSMDGGNKSYATGFSTYRSIRHHHNHHTLMHCKSYMDPKASALNNSCDRVGKVIEEHVNIFKIETTVNNQAASKMFTFLQKPGWEYNALDYSLYYGAKLGEMTLPTSALRGAYGALRAPYKLTSVHAGRTAPVHEKILERVYQDQCVPVQGQSDISVVGIPYLSPYNVNSIMNPILAYVMTLGYSFNLYRGLPVVRKGGVIIAIYPLHEDFHPVHHPSYIEFYNRILPETTDPKTIQDKYEEEFAYNPKYIDLYRNSYAFHGVHPFYMWYWGCYAMSYVSKVIFVKPRSKRPAEIMGFGTADSVAEAIEMAKDYVGTNPSITNFHCPPYLLLDVT